MWSALSGLPYHLCAAWPLSSMGVHGRALSQFAATLLPWATFKPAPTHTHPHHSHVPGISGPQACRPAQQTYQPQATLVCQASCSFDSGPLRASDCRVRGLMGLSELLWPSTWQPKIIIGLTSPAASALASQLCSCSNSALVCRRNGWQQGMLSALAACLSEFARLIYDWLRLWLYLLRDRP